VTANKKRRMIRY